MTTPRSLAIFGATGSIGSATLSVLDDYNEPYTLLVVTGNKNSKQMIEIAKKHQPKTIGMACEFCAGEVRETLASCLPSCKVVGGSDALKILAGLPYDWSMMAISGLFDALPITYQLAKFSKIVAIANKESIVAAGEIILETAKLHQNTILPVDSEHNAIYQAASHARKESIHSITLTASGGACRDISLQALHTVSLSDVLQHPVWHMGNKVTIDSATMVNKGLEIMEASVLFSLPEDKIHVLLHRNSIVHGIVHFSDGNSVAIMSQPDMRVAIAHTLGHPNRMKLHTHHLDLTAHSLHFSLPDPQRYPALKLARRALQQPLPMRIVFMVAAEVANAAFSKQQIKFTAMSDVIEKSMKLHNNNIEHISLPHIPSCLSFAASVQHTAEAIIQQNESLYHYG